MNSVFYYSDSYVTQKEGFIFSLFWIEPVEKLVHRENHVFS